MVKSSLSALTSKNTSLIFITNKVVWNFQSLFFFSVCDCFEFHCLKSLTTASKLTAPFPAVMARNNSLKFNYHSCMYVCVYVCNCSLHSSVFEIIFFVLKQLILKGSQCIGVASIAGALSEEV